MSALEKIKDIELELGRTQKNKATMSHIMSLKAKLAKYKRDLLDLNASGSGGGGGEGFEVKKTGDARVGLVGFPSVGKSTLLSTMTDTYSEVASYEFTTLTCIPGVIKHRGAKIQLLDLPGIVEGAKDGRGRGRQVIATARTCTMLMIVLDAVKSMSHKPIIEKVRQARAQRPAGLPGGPVDGRWCLVPSSVERLHGPWRAWHRPERTFGARRAQRGARVYERDAARAQERLPRPAATLRPSAICSAPRAAALTRRARARSPLGRQELEGFGIRLNQRPPAVTFRRKDKGGVSLSQTFKGESRYLDQQVAKVILAEYRINNADIVMHEDISGEQLIDVIEGNRVYMPCVYVLNKLDAISIEELEVRPGQARDPHALPRPTAPDVRSDPSVWCAVCLRRSSTSARTTARSRRTCAGTSTGCSRRSGSTSTSCASTPSPRAWCPTTTRPSSSRATTRRPSSASSSRSTSRCWSTSSTRSSGARP